MKSVVLVVVMMGFAAASAMSGAGKTLCFDFYESIKRTHVFRRLLQEFFGLILVVFPLIYPLSV